MPLNIHDFRNWGKAQQRVGFSAIPKGIKYKTYVRRWLEWHCSWSNQESYHNVK